ncbi:MAG: hypothetical protein NZT92_17155 [Abditibacteriales bacterium]|nr:hypothetical protein [Abditibacteriales bacterium]MDW8367595.1 hypothetical protein [Abditibacteriales bacterium]
MKRKLDNLSLAHDPRAAEWSALLDSWLRAEWDEAEARKWEGWVLDEVNRQKLPRGENHGNCSLTKKP